MILDCQYCSFVCLFVCVIVFNRRTLRLDLGGCVHRFSLLDNSIGPIRREAGAVRSYKDFSML